MPTLEIVRHPQTNECLVRIKGTDTSFMYDDDGLTFHGSAEEALVRARQYAASKGWEVDETIPERF